MKGVFVKNAGLSVLLALGACAAGTPPVALEPNPSSVETVTVSVGPCFGFCPVFDVTIASDGAVSFVGQRHTAVLGARRREAGADAYKMLASELAAFRPTLGTEARIPCDAAISDTSSYTVTWRGSDGRLTVATLQSRCPSGPAERLDAMLRELPDRLGIADWAKQTSRPGVSRG
ncbi:DUF6438 domain-containing protein [Sphingomonas faeni]|uniref:DUF6438 domain-containing protein n=1 Tax=Sphingomonas faeni TaxID=185950 RepID=UPI0027885FD0|nr:DUF6438 domain-containing protein [Sphingomonas faeni]MDQ0839328.1 hypothetical protein [Sphingomonas faeni]